MLSAIVGVNWGDEGKGQHRRLIFRRILISLSRYQGGNNAGHTVVNEKGTFILNLLPSGILRDGTVNVHRAREWLLISSTSSARSSRLREKGITRYPRKT